MNCLVSIIIPAYNCENYIRKCLNSIKRQTYQYFEVIIVDDGSTDETSSIVKKVNEIDERFLYLYQNNSGPSVARNYGLSKAKGKYIIFVDADDYLAKDYLQILLYKIENTKTDMCCCGYTNVTDNNMYQHNDFISKNFDKKKMLISLFKGTGGTICSKIFKKSILEKKNMCFNEKYSLCEDQLFILEYVCNCNKFSTIDYYGYYYVRRGSSITSRLNYDKWYNQINLLRNIEQILIKYNIDKGTIKNILNNKSFNILLNLLYRDQNVTYAITHNKLLDENIKWIYEKLSFNKKLKLIIFIPLKNKVKKMMKNGGNDSD